LGLTSYLSSWATARKGTRPRKREAILKKERDAKNFMKRREGKNHQGTREQENLKKNRGRKAPAEKRANLPR